MVKRSKKAKTLFPIFNRRLKFHSIDLLENQNLESIFLTEGEKYLLTKRIELQGKIKELKQEMIHLDNSIISQNRILTIIDTPQQTQFVKMIYGNKIISFHFVR